MSHDENGVIIKHTIINEDPIVKQKQYIKKPTIRLIYCRPFKDEKLVSSVFGVPQCLILGPLLFIMYSNK